MIALNLHLLVIGRGHKHTGMGVILENRLLCALRHAHVVALMAPVLESPDILHTQFGRGSRGKRQFELCGIVPIRNRAHIKGIGHALFAARRREPHLVLQNWTTNRNIPQIIVIAVFRVCVKRTVGIRIVSVITPMLPVPYRLCLCNSGNGIAAYASPPCSATCCAVCEFLVPANKVRLAISIAVLGRRIGLKTPHIPPIFFRIEIWPKVLLARGIVRAFCRTEIPAGLFGHKVHNPGADIPVFGIKTTREHLNLLDRGL